MRQSEVLGMILDIERTKADIILLRSCTALWFPPEGIALIGSARLPEEMDGPIDGWGTISKGNVMAATGCCLVESTDMIV